MHQPALTRRELLCGLACGAGILSGCRRAANASTPADAARLTAPDVVLKIAPLQFEVAPGHTVTTVAYNGSVPGPLVRFREGVAATVEIYNQTDTPEYVHWHGFEIPAELDGAEEEHSLVVPAHGSLRYRLTPLPSGSRFVHTHAMAMSDLNRGVFTGQYAFAFIEPRSNPARYDQEVFLSTHEWNPYLTSRETEDEDDASHSAGHKAAGEKNHGWEVAYRTYTVNGRCLGHSDPIRVKEGQRVLFHFLNASATESVKFALPGHRFQVVALDGNPVPNPQLVDVLHLGTAERIDAVVTMDTPGVYVLGSPNDKARERGMGIVVEYANGGGEPRWSKPPESKWDYTVFGKARRAPVKPDAIVPLVFTEAARSALGFDRWNINGKIYDPAIPPTRLAKGKRTRLVFDNRTDDAHPLHLHRNSFELVSVNGTPTAGIVKDVVEVKSRQKVEVDVAPRQEGLTLFHCHQQLHMDYGFKLLFDVA